MKEIIFQLKCIREHLKWIKTEYNPVDFDINVLTTCISQLEEMQDQTKITKHDSILRYGTVVEYKSCSVHFDVDSKSKDMFLIKDEDGNIIGRFVEVDE